MASVFLGIYYNLSVWYKVTNNTMAGAAITVGGALVTIALNWWWIPLFGYTGSAWATFICYASMMLVSYWWGQQKFPVPYAWKKLLAFIVIAVLVYLLFEKGIKPLVDSTVWQAGIGLVLLLVYAVFLMRVEKKELAGMPVIGKYFR
jgi:Na+-driven multidrug efflux pump